MQPFRFIHTADWHLGRDLHGADLGPSQAAFLEWLAELALEERVDAVLMAGDIYDRALPPVAAVELFRDGVARLAEIVPVVLITGNHDSTVRMSLGPLMRPEITLRSGTAELGRPVVLGDRVAVYPVPYLEPLLFAEELGVERGEGHQAVLESALARCRADLTEHQPAGTRAIAIAHAFVAGGAESESERPLAIGGAEQVPTRLFDGFSYTALGHLHLPQRLTVDSGPGRPGGEQAGEVIYAGSPIAYSFSEAGREKSVVLAELDPEGRVTFERRAVPVMRPVTRLTGTLDEVLTAAHFAEHEGDWLEITLTDEARPRNPMERLRQRFPGLLSLRFNHDPALAEVSTRERLERLQRDDPLELACEFVEHVRGAESSPAERDLLSRALASQSAQEQSG